MTGAGPGVDQPCSRTPLPGGGEPGPVRGAHGDINLLHIQEERRGVCLLNTRRFLPL